MRILQGPSNVAVLERDGHFLLIGCRPPEELSRAGVRPERVEWVLLTHHHRTACEGVHALAELGAKVAVPDAERDLFEHATAYWADDAHRHHTYHFHPSRLTLREDVPVHRGLHEYETLEWRGQPVLAIAAPGPTDGGMAYIVRSGASTTACVGELICGDGRMRDFHSLQGRRRWEHGEMMEYHGFGERAAIAVASLERVLEHKPDVLIPSRGELVRHPNEAVRRLRERVLACMDNYHSVSSVQWYFSAAWPDRHPDTRALERRCRALPPWVVEISPTSRAVVGRHGGVFLLDCAGDAPSRLRSLQQQGKLGHVEHLWITHYHDDHVERVNELRSAEGCAVVAHESMEDILRRPEAYCMPCLDPRPVPPDRVTRDREQWEWGGVRFTAFTFPGQTIYDAALLAERDGVRVLFVGDSLTPGGLDDYCAQNRNPVGRNVGYDRSLALLGELGPDVLLVNQHVSGAFVFSRDEVQRMREALSKRLVAFGRLLDWDDPNYGLDPQWVRADPYYCTVRGGETVGWHLMVHNYSSTESALRVTLRAPRQWKVVTGIVGRKVGPHMDGVVELTAEAPQMERRTRYVVGFSVEWRGRHLGEVAEAVVDVR